ncbi:IS630 family transposase [Methylobacterium sp. WL9]|uniref:IS630 family transposase n=1 Tax=Methylobacterium sp. WL9 TaxID=2603898 RepID=UPI001FEE1C6E|nr:IS630 family transposase [Methylobacterium sp. WL9]
MANFPYPQPYTRNTPRKSKLDPHKETIKLMLGNRDICSDTAQPSAAQIFRRLRCDHDFRGGYTAVKEYVRSLTAEREDIWRLVHGLVASLNEQSGAKLLRTLSASHPPIVSEKKTLSLYRAASKLLPARKPDLRKLQAEADLEWMRRLSQNDRVCDDCRSRIDTFPDTQILVDRLYNCRLSERNRAMTILARRQGIKGATTRSFLGICKGTYLQYLKIYSTGGVERLFAPKTRSTRKYDNEQLKQAVFRILHEPPSQYDINRTAWIMSDLSRVLGETGQSACNEVIRRITKEAGYRWRKARIQLTSQDPAYSEKLATVQAILSSLQPDEAFFSIDEFGPFAVKMKQGLKLDPPGSRRIMPQWQKSKGCLILTAALELSGNQVTHFYSERKNTDEMIRMMDLLLEKYVNCRVIYLSWDAASWHISKKLMKRIEEHNATAESLGRPRVETAPLPSGAQFLNVIESIFSGMARAVIHNSNYPSEEAARAAIDRYFGERNQQFRNKPKRAGNLIWGKERVPPAFSDSNNCKDPRWR